MTMPTLSVVVVTYNSSGVIEPCLRAVRARLPEAQIVVVDNASTDTTCRQCEEFGGISVMVNSSNVGFGRACNAGTDLAEGSHIMFLNPDVELVHVDHRGLQNELRRHPFGLMGASFRNGRHASPLLLPDPPWPREVVKHALGPLRPRELRALPSLRLRRSTWWPAGALLIARRDEFNRVGGFKRELFLYYEDRDLARRYRVAGLPLRATDSVVAIHTAGRSSAGADPLRTVAHGWAYLSWIEYVSTWNGLETARRAVAWADRLRRWANHALVRLESVGLLADRIERKRRQLDGIDAFVKRQSGDAAGAADRDFCPTARQIIAEREN